MSLEKEILQYLSESRNKKVLRYKGVRVGFFGLPDFKHYKYQTLANRCSDLKKKGYIRQENGVYFITYKGENFLRQKDRPVFETFETEKTENSTKDLLVMYDIPEERKIEREWFRRMLKKFHFIMVQRSVWVGPSPLPKEFLEYVKEIKLDSHFKTFKLAKGYIQK